VTGLLASAVFAAVAVLAANQFSRDLWAVVGDTDTQTVAEATSQGLPVDAPAVSRIRGNDLAADTAKAASDVQDAVVLLDDWSYTQSSSSPFFFGPPNGFDFFNPLFAMNFPTGSTGATGGTSPFGFSNAPPALMQVLNGATGSSATATSGSGTGSGASDPPSTGTTSTGGSSAAGDPPATNTFNFNGNTVNITSNTFNFFLPLPLGTGGGFSNRHAFSPIVVVISITITVNVNVNVSAST
jgi:hypothetical protein